MITLKYQVIHTMKLQTFLLSNIIIPINLQILKQKKNI